MTSPTTIPSRDLTPTSAPAPAQATALRDLPAFPDSVLRPGRLRRRNRARVTGTLVVLGAIAAGTTLVVQRITADDAVAYRTATVGQRTIAEVYDGVATVEPVSRATIAFPTSGTVTALDVAVGDTVAIGDVLAVLDTTELEHALRQAQSSLASAQLTLDVALSGEDPSSVTGGGQQAVGVALDTTADLVFAFASASPDSVSYSLASVSSDDVGAARQAVVDAQAAVTTATNTVAAARDSAVSICSAVDVTIDPNDPQGSITTIGQSLGACQTALDGLMAAQDDLTAAQSQLDAAADALDALLGTWADELASTPTPSTPSTTVPSTTPGTMPSSVPGTVPSTTPGDGSTPGGGSTPGDGSTPSNGSSPAGGSSPSGGGGAAGGGSAGGAATAAGQTTEEPTAAELIAYQADFDAAALAVQVAEQAIARATIASPLSGTVVTVGFAEGDSVSSASDTEAIVVQGAGGYEATLSVSVDDIDRILVGQPASLVPDGATEALSGEVVGITEVPESSGSTVSYRVTVGLDGNGEQADGVVTGNIGDLAITVRTGDDALAVPTSAVTPSAAGYTVTVLDATGAVTTTRVQIGAVGAEWTEITRGLEAGQTVVLADLSAPLPSEATDVQTSDATSNLPTGGFGPPSGDFQPPSGSGFPGAPPGG